MGGIRQLGFSLALGLPVLLSWPCGLASQEAVDLATSSSSPKQKVSTVPQPDGTDGLIRLDVTVRDASGQPVAGLTADDFTILDDEQPQAMVSFRPMNSDTSAEDLEVVLVLDEINLAPDQVRQAEHAIADYLQGTMGDLPHPALVYVLSSAGLSVTLGPSRDGNAIATELAMKKIMRLIWPADMLYEVNRLQGLAGRSSRNTLSLNAMGTIVIEEKKRPGRKLVFWMGNGWPLGEGCQDSFDWITEFSTRMREARIVLSGISAWPNPADRDLDYKESLRGVGSSKEKSSWALSLQVLAAQSGGEVIPRVKNIEHALEEAIDRESEYYTLSFDPPRARTADEYHMLRVQLKDATMAVKTSAGYYDQSIFYDDPPVAARHISVAELGELLQTFHGVSDGDGARRLQALELTERLSAKQLGEWKERLHGSKTRAALVALADASSFLNPPAEKATLAAPSLNEQRTMMSKTVTYVSKVMVRLPNFYAVRTIQRYREPQQKEEDNWKFPPSDQALTLKGTLSATMFYRNGAEVADASGMGRKNVSEQEKLNAMQGRWMGLVISREFTVAGTGHARDLRPDSQHGNRGCGAESFGVAGMGTARGRNARRI